MGDRLHLTQVPWSTIDDPCVWAALFGVHHHFSSSGESTKFGPGNHSQPGVSGSLRCRQNEKRQGFGYDYTIKLMLRLLSGLSNTHQVDFVDRERLCCTFTMRHQQFQTPITIKVCGYSSCRAITVMMQVNTSGNSLHSNHYPHAGKMDIMFQQS